MSVEGGIGAPDLREAMLEKDAREPVLAREGVWTLPVVLANRREMGSWEDCLRLREAVRQKVRLENAMECRQGKISTKRTLESILTEIVQRSKSNKSKRLLLGRRRFYCIWSELNYDFRCGHCGVAERGTEGGNGPLTFVSKNANPVRQP